MRQQMLLLLAMTPSKEEHHKTHFNKKKFYPNKTLAYVIRVLFSVKLPSGDCS